MTLHLSDITQSSYTFYARVIGSGPTMHRVVSIIDANGCPGDTASGKAWLSYKTSPKAVISGSDSICPGTTATLNIALTGTAPWSITYLRDGANPITISNISTSPYKLNVTNTGTYSLSDVKDINNLSGCVSGSADIRLHTVPTAVLSGTATVCEHTAANLNVALTGTISMAVLLYTKTWATRYWCRMLQQAQNPCLYTKQEHIHCIKSLTAMHAGEQFQAAL